LLAYALSGPSWRLGFVRAGLILAAAAVVGVEGLSALGWLTRAGIFTFWALASGVLGPHGAGGWRPRITLTTA
jgi:hypothetical protein